MSVVKGALNLISAEICWRPLTRGAQTQTSDWDQVSREREREWAEWELITELTLLYRDQRRPFRLLMA